ncbi:hypothetical protein, partial [Rickettsia asembonensis]
STLPLCHSRRSGNPKNNFNTAIKLLLIDKINLKKQVFYSFYWIPALAGMTKTEPCNNVYGSSQ